MSKSRLDLIMKHHVAEDVATTQEVQFYGGLVISTNHPAIYLKLREPMLGQSKDC
ncbi:MAG: hypothetical protein WA843_03940 [Candidatus Saccharimonadales bacterium]